MPPYCKDYDEEDEEDDDDDDEDDEDDEEDDDDEDSEEEEEQVSWSQGPSTCRPTIDNLPTSLLSSPTNCPDLPTRLPTVLTCQLSPPAN
jgi:hypothetical protein